MKRFIKFTATKNIHKTRNRFSLGRNINKPGTAQVGAISNAQK